MSTSLIQVRFTQAGDFVTAIVDDDAAKHIEIPTSKLELLGELLEGLSTPDAGRQVRDEYRRAVERVLAPVWAAISSRLQQALAAAPRYENVELALTFGDDDTRTLLYERIVWGALHFDSRAVAVGDSARIVVRHVCAAVQSQVSIRPGAPVLLLDALGSTESDERCRREHIEMLRQVFPREATQGTVKSLEDLVTAIKMAKVGTCVLLLAHGAPSWIRLGSTPVSAAELAASLESASFAQKIPLAALMVCSSGSPGAVGGSLASRLHRLGVGAVISAALPLSTSGSLRFSRAFWSALGCRTLAHAFRLGVEAAEGLDRVALQLWTSSSAGGDARQRQLQWPRGRSPFPGPAPFLPEDVDIYVDADGRAARVEVAITELGAALHLVTAPSGAGKSSLLGFVANRRAAAVVLREPTLELVDSARLSPGDTLIVDQLDEALLNVPQSAQKLLDRMLAWARAGVVVIAGVRSGAPLARWSVEGRQLTNLLVEGASTGLVCVHALALLDRESFGQILDRVSERFGLSIDDRLRGDLLAAVRGQPHALPLFQLTLQALWDAHWRRDGRPYTLDHDLWRHVGVEADHSRELALAAVAERTLARELTSANSRRLLASLVRHDGDGFVRRPRQRVELDKRGIEAETIERFIRQRFIVGDGGRIEVAHSSLLHLRSCLDALREWEHALQAEGRIQVAQRAVAKPAASDLEVVHAAANEHEWLFDAPLVTFVEETRSAARLRWFLLSALVVGVIAGFAAIAWRASKSEQAARENGRRVVAGSLARGLDDLTRAQFPELALKLYADATGSLTPRGRAALDAEPEVRLRLQRALGLPGASSVLTINEAQNAHSRVAHLLFAPPSGPPPNVMTTSFLGGSITLGTSGMSRTVTLELDDGSRLIQELVAKPGVNEHGLALLAKVDQGFDAIGARWTPRGWQITTRSHLAAPEDGAYPNFIIPTADGVVVGFVGSYEVHSGSSLRCRGFGQLSDARVIITDQIATVLRPNGVQARSASARPCPLAGCESDEIRNVALNSVFFFSTATCERTNEEGAVDDKFLRGVATSPVVLTGWSLPDAGLSVQLQNTACGDYDTDTTRPLPSCAPVALDRHACVLGCRDLLKVAGSEFPIALQEASGPWKGAAMNSQSAVLEDETLLLVRPLETTFLAHAYDVPRRPHWAAPRVSASGAFLLWPTARRAEIWTSDGRLFQSCPSLDQSAQPAVDDEGALWWGADGQRSRCRGGITEFVGDGGPAQSAGDQRAGPTMSCLPDKRSRATPLNSTWAWNEELGVPFYCGPDLITHIHELLRAHPVQVSASVRPGEMFQFPSADVLEVFDP